MTLDEYQKHALRTAPREEYPPFVPELGRAAFDRMIWALGLTGEAGEVADLLKKGIGHGHGIDPDEIKKELGDVLWYLAVLAHSFGLNLSNVAQTNVEKLKARYPDGFTTEASQARVDYSPTHACKGSPCSSCGR